MENLDNFLTQPVVNPQRKKTLKEGEPKNASFLTLENINWWLFVTMNYMPPLEKRCMFLPCAGAFKTRSENDPRKFISQSTSHQYMKAIRENPSNANIILSEPCTLIPYDEIDHLWESHPLRPDYNLPPDFLSVQGEFIFIERLSHFLLKMKMFQPSRRHIFYFGGCHHYFILHYSNELAGHPFDIIYDVPKNGTAGYGKESEKFMTRIQQMEMTQHFEVPEPISIEKELQKRSGRYTHKPFLLALIEAERLGHSKSEVNEYRIEISKKTAFQEGFGKVYSQIIPCAN